MSSNDDVHTVEVDLNEWEGVMHERDELRGEVEQLKDEVLDANLRCVYEVRESQAEVERLRINLRDYRQRHRCSHEVMCWADEIASKALGRAKE